MELTDNGIVHKPHRIADFTQSVKKELRIAEAGFSPMLVELEKQGGLPLEDLFQVLDRETVGAAGEI